MLYAGHPCVQPQREISPPPPQCSVVTLDLFKENGPFVLTGFAPTAMGGPAYFDRIELLREVGGRDEGSGIRTQVSDP